MVKVYGSVRSSLFSIRMLEIKPIDFMIKILMTGKMNVNKKEKARINHANKLLLKYNSGKRVINAEKMTIGISKG